MGRVQLMLCLLSAGFVKSSFLQLRRFEVTDGTRDNAYDYCRSNNSSLVTLYDIDDAKFVINLINITMKTAWVGLHKKTNNSSESPLCPSTFQPTNCSEILYFTCERDLKISSVKLNWCAAKQYCQYHSLGDLGNSSVLSRKETMWIGGNISDNWAWDDGGCSTYRKWKNLYDEHNATTMYLDYTISSSFPDVDILGVCSKGDLRIVVVDKELPWEQALDYCDTHHSGLLQILTPEHQTSVEDWLKGTNHTGTFWVGLRQSRVFGFWIWKDRMVDSSNWEHGTHPQMPLSHHCGVIETSKYKWRDHNCLFPLPFICEERIVWLNKP